MFNPNEIDKYNLFTSMVYPEIDMCKVLLNNAIRSAYNIYMIPLNVAVLSFAALKDLLSQQEQKAT